MKNLKQFEEYNYDDNWWEKPMPKKEKSNIYGIDEEWIDIWEDVKHLDLQKMDWIDVIVLLGREFNPPTRRRK